jgi:hypothetical protein
MTGLTILLWLTGCATIEPIGSVDNQDSNKAATQNSTTHHIEQIQSAKIERYDQPVTTISDEMETLTLSKLLQRLDRVSALSPDTTKALIKQMEARFEELTPVEKYEFALLLTFKKANYKTLKRAIALMDELQAHAKDRLTQEILQLHHRNLVLEKQYRSEQYKTKELNKKIERLKGLEQDLDKSNTHMRKSPNPPPRNVR